MATSGVRRLALWRLPVWLLYAATLLSAAPQAMAQAAGNGGNAGTIEQGVRRLDQIPRAAQQENYEGVFVYQRGTFVQSSRIVHYATRGGEFESLESLDGKPRK